MGHQVLALEGGKDWHMPGPKTGIRSYSTILPLHGVLKKVRVKELSIVMSYFFFRLRGSLHVGTADELKSVTNFPWFVVCEVRFVNRRITTNFHEL